jgi:hypothetical protein
MPKSKIDKAREERIQNEIVVDCYNESERFGGWYCYLEEKLKFPFSALCVATSPVSPLKRGEQVEVIGMLDDERHEPGEISVRILWQRGKWECHSLSWRGFTWVLSWRKPLPIGITGVHVAIVSKNSNTSSLQSRQFQGHHFSPQLNPKID